MQETYGIVTMPTSLDRSENFRKMVILNKRPPFPPPEILKVKFTLYQATKAQRGSRGIALLFL